MSIIKRNGGTKFLEGTDAEALEFAGRAHQHLALRGVVRVEARSIEIIETPTGDPEQRKLFVLREKRQGGWQADAFGLAHPCWHTNLEDALSYAAFRGRGYCCEIRTMNRTGELAQVILVDQSKEGANCVVMPGWGGLTR